MNRVGTALTVLALAGRLGVYEFLSDLAKNRRLKGQAVERPYLELLKEGLADSDRGFRRTAVDALASAEPGVQKEVAGWITPLLEDPALARIEDAAKHKDERVSKAAAQMLEAMKKHP